MVRLALQSELDRRPAVHVCHGDATLPLQLEQRQLEVGPAGQQVPVQRVQPVRENQRAGRRLLGGQVRHVAGVELIGRLLWKWGIRGGGYMW